MDMGIRELSSGNLTKCWGFGNSSSLDQGEMSQCQALVQPDLGPSGPAVGR